MREARALRRVVGVRAVGAATESDWAHTSSFARFGSFWRALR